MNLPLFRAYPLGRVAALAALAGLAIPFALRVDPMENPDSIAFVALARSVLAGTGLHYQEPLIPGVDLYAFRAPGYPLFLVPGLAFGGAPAIVAIQGLLNGLAAALLGAIALRLGGGPGAAWIAFAIRLAWPFGWYYSTQLSSETLYEFLGILATWLVLEGVARRQLAWSVGAAAATAFSILCRPVGIGLALALGLWLLLKFPRSALVYAAATLLLWLPWPIRNARVLHALVPFTTNGGATAWAGTTDGNVRPAYDWMGANAGRGEVGFDRHFREQAQRNLRAHPAAAVKAALQRGFTYLGPIRSRDPGAGLHRFAMLGAAAALVMGLLSRHLVLPSLIWAAQGAVMLPIFLIERYRFPTEWCVALAAAFGLAGLAARIGPRRAGVAAAAALAACVAGSLALARGLRVG